MPDGYENYLTEILTYHENESPISHIRKFELVKGDVSVTIDEYFKKHPETIAALAYFDLDLYLPTKKCLQAIRNRIAKGSILVFDELNISVFPGETIALMEEFNLNNLRLYRSPIDPLISYYVVD